MPCLQGYKWSGNYSHFLDHSSPITAAGDAFGALTVGRTVFTPHLLPTTIYHTPAPGNVQSMLHQGMHVIISGGLGGAAATNGFMVHNLSIFSIKLLPVPFYAL